MQKFARKFAYIKKMYYLCNVFRKRAGTNPKKLTNKTTKKMKATTAIKNLEEVARADKAVLGKNWKLTAEWRLIMETLKPSAMALILHKGQIRPCYYSGSGRFTTKQDHTAGVRYLLVRAKIRFTETNDAPRGSETGNLITLTRIEY